MSTLMICTRCGGVIGGGAGSGRPCTCSRGGVATATATTAASSSDSLGSVAGVVGVAAGRKVCCICGADVTNQRRMKDSATGRYWCYDCGAADQLRKHAGVLMTCADCRKQFPPVQMVRPDKNDAHVYVCAQCAAIRAGKEHAPGQVAGSAAQTKKDQIKLIIGSVVVIVVLFVLLLLLNGLV